MKRLLIPVLLVVMVTSCEEVNPADDTPVTKELLTRFSFPEQISLIDEGEDFILDYLKDTPVTHDSSTENEILECSIKPENLDSSLNIYLTYTFYQDHLIRINLLNTDAADQFHLCRSMSMLASDQLGPDSSNHQVYYTSAGKEVSKSFHSVAALWKYISDTGIDEERLIQIQFSWTRGDAEAGIYFTGNPYNSFYAAIQLEKEPEPPGDPVTMKMNW